MIASILDVAFSVKGLVTMQRIVLMILSAANVQDHMELRDVHIVYAVLTVKKLVTMRRNINIQHLILIACAMSLSKRN